MSGNRAPSGPRYRAKAQAPGWWCCNSLMVPGEIPAAGDVRMCRRCGEVILVAGDTLLETMHAGQRRRRRTRRR